LITQLRSTFSVAELCAALDVSRAGYHASLQRPPSLRSVANDALLEQIRGVHNHRHTRSYGSPRMTHTLRHQGVACSENRVARIMRENGLRARPRRPFRPRTTDPDHAAHPSPNLLLQAEAPTAPGQQIVSDITYVPTAEGWLYLAVVMDLFSRSILGWKVSEHLHSDLTCSALSNAMATGIVPLSAIFHSDRGCQYTSSQFRTEITRFQLQQSMSAKGYCYDNAFAESLFASIKNELLPNDHCFPSRRSARTAIFDYIETFYNSKRLHSSLNYSTPHSVLAKSFHSSLN
jgi:putative transposase